LLDQGTGGHIAFTASFAGLVPNAGLGAYGVAKYGVVSLAETLAREVKDTGIGGVGALPDDRRNQLVSNSERIRGADYGLSSIPDVTGDLRPLPAQDDSLGVEEVARLTADAILANRFVHPAAHGRPARQSAADLSASTARSTFRPSRAGVTS